MKARRPSHKDKIEEIWKEDDGWWIFLIQGWTVDDSRQLREDTKKQLFERLKDAKFTGLD